jgi:hypothetical protein
VRVAGLNGGGMGKGLNGQVTFEMKPEARESLGHL